MVKFRIKYPCKAIPEWFERWFTKNFGDDEVYTPLQVANILNRHPESIYRALRNAELEGIKIGKRSYLIPRDALKKWLLHKNVVNVEDF